MKRLISLFIFLFATACYGSVNIYEFDSPVDEKRFQELTRQLRCPKCQNQNIADSNAPQAEDLRNYTYEMVKDGRADSEIVSFMVQRYGDFVTYKPPVKPITWALWFLPIAILLLILVYVFILRKPKNELEITTTLTDEEQAKLEKILNKD